MIATKTDTTLKQDILDELEWDPGIDAARVGVIVKNAVVTLSGKVNTYAEKVMAEKAAKRVYGVRAVVQDIEVKPAGNMQYKDQDIAAAAIHSLRWNTNVPDERIKLKVEDGWITLDGTVDWNYQKNAAKSAVQNLAGVRGVINIINVKTAIEPYNLKERIKKAFERNAQIDAGNVDVKVEERKVVLSGHVQSWAEKRQAREAAWSAPGVAEVEGHIEIRAREFA